jgi:hypothetical protein
VWLNLYRLPDDPVMCLDSLTHKLVSREYVAFCCGWLAWMRETDVLMVLYGSSLNETSGLFNADGSALKGDAAHSQCL